MAGKRSAQLAQSESRQRQKARVDLATALLRAITDVGLSQEGAARAIGVAKRTIGSWVRCEREMNVEAVLATPRIGRLFRVHLCAHKHDDPVPYVARKGRR